jgi:endonuclease/exonuclease/phosphatase family metal-dependent hydrolase
MSTKFRIATYNAENLFSRAKVFNQSDPSIGDDAIKKIGELENELKKTVYDKAKILNLYNQVKKYVTVNEEMGKLWKKSGYQITGVAANGTNDWAGSLVFKKAKFNEMERSNTAKVIKTVKADLMCLVEVENKPTITSFNSQLLNSKYKYNILIDANDPRGIDVGAYSKFEFGGVWTHMYDRKNNKRIFSRDCLEVEVHISKNKVLYLLCNHFKSKGYGVTSESNDKRKAQAERVAEILKNEYDLNNDLVVVAGDLNDTPDSAPLKPLMDVAGMKDVLKMQFPADAGKRWTYHYNSNQQIDFMLVSKPLQNAFVKAGVERRGIYNLSSFTGGAEKSFETVTSKARQASDHGAVWADFSL